MMAIPQINFTEARGNVTESNSKRYEWILAGPALPNENIPYWYGKVL